MYPEEKLGAGIQSASIMWERVEALFQPFSRYKGGNGKERQCAFRIVFDTMDIGMYGCL
jgi:hypothetical protein